MNLRPYHAALANQISALSVVSTSMDLGRAIGFAELAQTAFIPPADRHEVLEAFDDLKGRVSKASLKTAQKRQVATAIDNAIRMIKVQPEKMLAQNGAGDHTMSKDSSHPSHRQSA